MTERREATATHEAEPIPRYEDDEAESLGERLAELYAARDQHPDPALDEAIERTRRQLRRGPRLRPGEFLKDGRYRLIERIGDSAGDATWKAWDRSSRGWVVIKEMLGPWVARRMRVGTFLEAARVLQQVAHPGLAPLHEATQSRDGFVYLATDWLPGGRLDRFEGDAVDLLQAVVEVAEALQAAHDAGLVHARLRPEAIYFASDGAAKVADFDLAGEHVHSESGSIFAAPEMVERGAEAKPASDVYALAMCALYVLNGNHLPYTVVRGPERLIERLDVPDSVKRVLARALDWDLDVRYGSMAAFADDLLADPDVLGELAQRALDRERFDIAGRHFTALRELRPEDDVRIQHILGQIYLQTQAWDRAYEALASALEAAREPDPLYPHLRQYAESTGDWKRVADLLWNQARDRHPVVRASMRAELARITERWLDDPRGAAEIWTLVVQDHRTVERGREAYQALRRLAEARGDWEVFVRTSRRLLPYLHPDERPPVAYTIGRALLQHLGDEEGGLRWIDRAEAGGIQPLDMVKELQQIRARRGQWRRMLGLMRLQAAHEERVHQASRILLRAATIARAVHLEAEAEAIYEDLLRRAPQHYPALRELARIWHRKGRSERAMEAYATLTRNYEGKPEAHEASERATDYTAYARLLVDHGRHEEALEQLAAALDIQPGHVEALRLVGPLHLDMGRLDEAARAFGQLYALFNAVDTRGARVDIALQRAEVAWFRGRLAVAMRWFNTVLAAVPDHPRAWWGLAKVAIAARGGHPGTERAPWLSACPPGFTAHEALARLLMGLVREDACRGWLDLLPLGRAAAQAGATPGRAACLVVDILDRYAFIGPELFERLREARTAWTSRIDRVEDLFAGTRTTFSADEVHEVESWSRSVEGVGFGVGERRYLPPGDPLFGRLLYAVEQDEAWAVLFGGAMPEEREVVDAPSPEPVEVLPPPSLEWMEGDERVYVFDPDARCALVGSAPSCDWVEEDLADRHLRMIRVGDAIYLEPVQGSLAVDGDDVPGWRVSGGEEVRLGEHRWTLRVDGGRSEADVVAEDDTLPERPEEDGSEEERGATVAEESGCTPDDDASGGAEEPAGSGEAARFGEPPRSEEPEDTEDAEDTLVGLPPIRREDVERMEEAPPWGLRTEALEARPAEMVTSPEEDLEQEAPVVPRAGGGEEPLPEPGDDHDEVSLAPEPLDEPEEGFADEPTVTIRAPQPVDDLAVLVDRVGTDAADSPRPLDASEVVEPGEAPEDSLGPAVDAPTPHGLLGQLEPDRVDTVRTGSGRPTIEPSVSRERNLPAGAMVEVMSGPVRGTIVAVNGVLALGRDASCEIHLPADPMLADIHCKFVASEAGYMIMDAGTERGTMVDGSRVSEATLRGGETIMVGSTVLRFVVRD